MLAVAPFVGGDGDDVVGVRTEIATSGDGEVVQAAGLGTPSGVRELLSDTTTTLVEATGATTSTTSTTEVAAAAPATSTSTSTSTSAAAEIEDEDRQEPTTTTTEGSRARALHTAPAEDGSTPADPPAPAATQASTTTTTAPRRAPTTTAAPTTTTTTTAPEPAGDDSSTQGYAYDDPRSTQVWYDLADCESGGNWSTDTGNGYYGGLQFSLSSWESVGGSGYPHEHPAATQIDFGRKLQARQGWGAWPHCSEKLGLR